MKYFKQHPVVMTLMIVYNIVCIITLISGLAVQARMKDNPGMSGIAAGGEGVFSLLILLVIGICLANFICAMRAMIRNKPSSFYLWVCVIVVVEMFVVLNIAG